VEADDQLEAVTRRWQPVDAPFRLVAADEDFERTIGPEMEPFAAVIEGVAVLGIVEEEEVPVIEDQGPEGVDRRGLSGLEAQAIAVGAAQRFAVRSLPRAEIERLLIRLRARAEG